MIRSEGNVGIQVSNDVKLEMPDPLETRIKRMHFASKTAVQPLRAADKLDPRTTSSIFLHDFRRPVCGAIIHNYPSLGQHCLGDH
jgi:hypothetical protein